MTHITKIATILVLPLLLAACLFTPGKFESELMLNKDGQFTFTYDGEITVGGLQQLMTLAAQSEEEGFQAKCHKEEGLEETAYNKTSDFLHAQGNERDCTEAEAQEQLEAKKKENQKYLDVFKSMFGGTDLSSPEALEKLLERTRKQKGWTKIDRRDDGVFEVEYEISGNMDRNFTFPHFEQISGNAPFVETVVRQDAKVRIEAPGFSPQEDSSSLGLFTALAALGASDKEEEVSFDEEEDKTDISALLPGLSGPQGTFRIVTNSEILTNNTEEGPVTKGASKVLTWQIDDQTTDAPRALIKLQ